MKISTKYILPVLTAACAVGLSSCLEEYTPTNQASQEQVDKADLNGLANAIAAYTTNASTDDYFDVGFATNLIWRDGMTADMPVYDSGYDYFSYVGNCSVLGGYWSVAYYFWTRYYRQIQKSNLLLKAVSDTPDESQMEYVASALGYRAMCYLEMAQIYEYHDCGIGALNAQAEENGIMGLTVPIVTEKTTEAESRNNPRVPFWEMYRFILTDLNRAESYLKGTGIAASRVTADAGVIQGLKARLWLYLGTRFDRHPEDLATATSHESEGEYDPLGITSAKECFTKAAAAARAAINQGYTPLSQTQWFDPKTGFNSVNSSWMWAIIINSDNKLASSYTWQSWVSFMSPEAEYGVACSDYGAYRMIDARLYSSIPDADWRKTTWIGPADAGNENAFNTKYARGTSLGFSDWSKYAAYCGMKYHPNAGDGSTSTTGNAVSIPLMRVEEMYLIEAEATGRANGEAAGRALLENFVNSYRYTDGSYKSRGAGMDGFINDVFTQKRIELWGEGQILWDYRRLEHEITRGYPGTNWPSSYRFNSQPNLVAPWTTMCIPDLEQNYNTAVILNPDPTHTGLYEAWTE